MHNVSFVQRCTNNCPDYSSLRQDAISLLLRLQLQRQNGSVVLNKADKIEGCFFVPIKSYDMYSKRMNEILVDCTQLQSEIAKLRSEKRTTIEIRDVGIIGLLATAKMGKDVISDEENYAKVKETMNKVGTHRREMAVSGDHPPKSIHTDHASGKTRHTFEITREFYARVWCISTC